MERFVSGIADVIEAGRRIRDTAWDRVFEKTPTRAHCNFTTPAQPARAGCFSMTEGRELMTTIRNLMIAGALVFAATPALAEDAHHPPEGKASAPAATPQAPALKPGMAGGGMMSMMGGNAMSMMGLMMAPERIEGRIAFLRAELKITDAQQPLWSNFAEALRSNARDMMGGMQQMMASMQGGAAPSLMQRVDGHERMLVAHLEALRRMKAALTPLYGALDDTQKRTADQLLMPGAMGPM